MKIIILNSGSNGNAVYVESSESGAGILLDCGISRKQIESKLKIHGRFLESINAIFITHEHQDHVRGLYVLSKSHHMPVYGSTQTMHSMWKHDSIKTMKLIHNMESVQVADITVQAFPKNHDAADPVFFVVTIAKKKFLYATDLGTHNEELIQLLPEVDALMLESNYDFDMLMNGIYPPDIKERIHSDHGHLSNVQCMELIERHCHAHLKVLIFGHISENNNTPQIVEREYHSMMERKKNFTPRMHIASRYDVSEIIEV